MKKRLLLLLIVISSSITYATNLSTYNGLEAGLEISQTSPALFRCKITHIDSLGIVFVPIRDVYFSRISESVLFYEGQMYALQSKSIVRIVFEGGTEVREIGGLLTITHQGLTAEEIIENQRLEAEQIKKQQEAEKQAKLMAERDKLQKYTASYAFKKSGAYMVGLGVPILAAGTIVLACGHSGVAGSGVHGLVTNSQLIEAGEILMPIGASMTLIGIPLYSFGVKLEKKEHLVTIVTNGTGVGVSVSL